MWQYQNTDELYHYGVLGMKWGMRRAYRKGIDYQYKSIGQKKYEKRVNKLTNKVDKLASQGKRPSFATKNKLDVSQRKLKQYVGRDKNRQDYAKTANIGKSALKTLMFGPFGAGNYNRFRSAGHGRMLSALGSNYISSTLGYPVTLLLSKGSENRQGRLRAKEEELEAELRKKK